MLLRAEGEVEMQDVLNVVGTQRSEMLALHDPLHVLDSLGPTLAAEVGGIRHSMAKAALGGELNFCRPGFLIQSGQARQAIRAWSGEGPWLSMATSAFGFRFWGLTCQDLKLQLI